jgi:hypothetical protein
MPDYRRFWVPGRTYFFTENLLERRLDLRNRNCSDIQRLNANNPAFLLARRKK